MKKHIGDFQLTCGVMRVTDPCYDPDTWCSGSFGAKNGTWKAAVTMSDCGEWGNRVVELEVRHIDHPSVTYSDAPENIDVGVDSGQCGFFDHDTYIAKKSADKTADHERSTWGGGPFYDDVCDLTTDAKMNCRRDGGTLPFGAVSPSGFGDGSYLCYTAKDHDGQIVAAKVIFISDEEDEEEEEMSEEEAHEAGACYPSCGFCDEEENEREREER